MRDRTKNIPEILAPAGNMAMVEAAVAGGADAIYISGKNFGARAYAENFDYETIKALVKRLHLKGVKLYVTVNTAIKDQEMDKAVEEIVFLYNAGVDAVIIQDPGLIYAINKIIPDMELHGSTQLSVYSLAGAKALKSWGITRLVLARECSKREAALIGGQSGPELEIFVHGSLCVSISGQCLLSSYQGGRSGNRGRCAQSCRKTYVPVRTDGKALGPEAPYLSPADLYTAEMASDYRGIGIDSLKIEGRMKKPEYVYMAAKTYKQALKGEAFDPSGLLSTSNRSFTQGFFFDRFGSDILNKEKIDPRLEVGIVKIGGKGPYFIAKKDLFKGDQVVLEGARSKFPLTFTDKYPSGATVDLSQCPDLKAESPVNLVYIEKNRQDLNNDIKLQDSSKLGLDMQCQFHIGKPIKLDLYSCGIHYTYEGDPVEPAVNRPVDEDGLKKNLSKLGSSPFYLKDLKIDIRGEGFMPLGAINAARRAAVQGLIDKISLPNRGKIGVEQSLEDLKKIYREDFDKIKDSVNFPRIFNDGLCDQGKAGGDKEIFLMTPRPADYFKDLEKPDLVICYDPDNVKDWKQAGSDVFIEVPMLMEAPDAQAFFKDCVGIEDQIDGFYVNTINELAYVMDRVKSGKISENAQLILGAGLQVFNSLALIPIFKMIGKLRIRGILHSTELVDEEIGNLAYQDLSFTQILYGRPVAMHMKHCPMTYIKGCKDQKDCTVCKLSRNVFLKDQFGYREVYRKRGLSRLLNTDLLDLRIDPEKVGNHKSYLIIDRGEPEIGHVIEDFRLIIDSSEPSLKNTIKKRIGKEYKIDGISFKRRTAFEDKAIL